MLPYFLTGFVVFVSAGCFYLGISGVNARINDLEHRWLKDELTSTDWKAVSIASLERRVKRLEAVQEDSSSPNDECKRLQAEIARLDEIIVNKDSTIQALSKLIGQGR